MEEKRNGKRDRAINRRSTLLYVEKKLRPNLQTGLYTIHEKNKMIVFFRELAFDTLFNFLQPGEAVICHFLPAAFTDDEMVTPCKFLEICHGRTFIFLMI
jgi:hypothetical protein